MNIKGKHITILGAVRSGIGAAKLAYKLGAIPFVSDMSPEYKIEDSLAVLREFGIEYECGGHSEKVYECDFIVTSPGVPTDSQVLLNARQKKVRVISELEFASWYCKGKVIGITGTNGKTTTTNLMAHIINKSGRKAYLAGNIGYAFSEIAMDVKEDEFVALEISSFQLDYIKNFKTYIAIILNITQDHLDRYQNRFELYAKSKLDITSNQTEDEFFIINADDKYLSSIEIETDAEIKLFSTRNGIDNGTYIKEENFIYSSNDNEEVVCSVSDLSLSGEHNQSNALSTITVAKIIGIENDSIKDSLSSFPGVEHRLEFVRELNGVKYINDSKATNVDAVWYALQSYENPIYLILGGKDKGNDYSQILNLVKENVKKIYAIGSSAETVDRYFNPFIKVEIVKTMADAVKKAQEDTTEGDLVLLSPACASFDMYKSYEHRGTDFKEEVNKLS